jgi:hypothetical protein
MRYDLDLVYQLCREIGLSVLRRGDERVEIDLGEDAVLCIQNFEGEDDCAIGFLGTEWHMHENPMFMDARGSYIQMDYLDVIVGLKDGWLLIGERHVAGRLADRWLLHGEYNDTFKYLAEGERIIVRRALSHEMEHPGFRIAGRQL